jgi:vacuolar-type H+-ATPase subunit I/STV1
MSRRKLELSPITGESGDAFGQAISAPPPPKNKKKDTKLENMEKSVDTLEAKVDRAIETLEAKVNMIISLENESSQETKSLKEQLEKLKKASVSKAEFEKLKKATIKNETLEDLREDLVDKNELSKFKEELEQEHKDLAAKSDVEALKNNFEMAIRKSEIACGLHEWICQKQLAEKLIEAEEETRRFSNPRDTSVYDLFNFQSKFLEAIATTLGPEATLLYKIARFSLLEFESLSVAEKTTKMISSSSVIFSELSDTR